MFLKGIEPCTRSAMVKNVTISGIWQTTISYVKGMKCIFFALLRRACVRMVSGWWACGWVVGVWLGGGRVVGWWTCGWVVAAAAAAARSTHHPTKHSPHAHHPTTPRAHHPTQSAGVAGRGGARAGAARGRCQNSSFCFNHRLLYQNSYIILRNLFIYI